MKGPSWLEGTQTLRITSEQLPSSKANSTSTACLLPETGTSLKAMWRQRTPVQKTPGTMAPTTHTNDLTPSGRHRRMCCIYWRTMTPPSSPTRHVTTASSPAQLLGGPCLHTSGEAPGLHNPRPTKTWSRKCHCLGFVFCFLFPNTEQFFFLY